MASQPPAPGSSRSHARPLECLVRQLRETELAEADRIFRTAFGTFVGLPDPMTFAAGRDFVRSRWLVNPTGAFGAEVDGKLAGCCFGTRWGSFGFLGPLVVRPEYWDCGVGKRLMAQTVQLFDAWSLRQTGLFTFPHSPKHIGLYQQFGYWPRFLTALMIKPVGASSGAAEGVRFSQLNDSAQAEALRACRDLTTRLAEGLDLESEIRASDRHHLGETILLWEGSRLAAFAVCQFGPGSEGGPETCYVKFAAAAPGHGAAVSFGRLLDACETLARGQGLKGLEGGVSLEHPEAFRQLRAHGFQSKMQGVAMHRPNEPLYVPGADYIIEDWR